LMARFELTEIQAQAILDMQLRRLAALERQKIEDEYLELIQRITYLEDLLVSPRKVLYLIKEELAELKRAYGDGRRTRIVEGEQEFEEGDLAVEEDVLVKITRRGTIMRVPVEACRAEGRGGRGRTGVTARDDDDAMYLFSAQTLDSILFFSNLGKVYQERVYQIPDAGRAAGGVLVTSILALDADERITAALAVPGTGPDGYLMMVTRQGRAKRVELNELSSVRPGGLVAIRLDDGDELGWVSHMRGDGDVIVVTGQGQALRFRGETVRPMGCAAAGVNAIKLDPGDYVADASAIERCPEVAEGPQAELLTVTTRGYGKRTPLSEFPVKGRYGKGVRCLGGERERTGVIAAARVVRPDDDVTLVSSVGVVLRTRAAEVPQMGRAARGAKVMDLEPGDEVASVAVVNSEPMNNEQ
jgi:DNA gyrase subunit A